MHVASLDLCRELHKLSGWVVHQYTYRITDGRGHEWVDIADRGWCDNWTPRNRDEKIDYAPAYDLGFLIRKLPKRFNIAPDTIGEEIYPLTINADGDNCWIAAYGFDDLYKDLGFDGDTPENALCQLAITLFEKGILVKEKV